MSASQAAWFFGGWFAASILVSSAAVIFLFRKISDIDDSTESDLRENFPAANPQPPAESIQEAVRIHDQTR